MVVHGACIARPFLTNRLHTANVTTGLLGAIFERLVWSGCVFFIVVSLILSRRAVNSRITTSRPADSIFENSESVISVL
jgi:hypothetical protein